MRPVADSGNQVKGLFSTNLPTLFANRTELQVVTGADVYKFLSKDHKGNPVQHYPCSQASPIFCSSISLSIIHQSGRVGKTEENKNGGGLGTRLVQHHARQRPPNKSISTI